MKIKLDENFDPRAKDILALAGHDVCTIQDEAISGADDGIVARYANAEGRCLVTLDLDFANVLVYPPEKYAGLVVFHHPHPTAQGILRLVDQFAKFLPEQKPQKHLWIVEPGRIRVHEESLD